MKSTFKKIIARYSKQSEIDRVREINTQLKQLTASLTERINDQEGKLCSLRALVSSMEKAESVVMEENAQLKQLKTSLTVRITDQEGELHSLKMLIGDLESQNKSLLKQLAKPERKAPQAESTQPLRQYDIDKEKEHLSKVKKQDSLTHPAMKKVKSTVGKGVTNNRSRFEKKESATFSESGTVCISEPEILARGKKLWERSDTELYDDTDYMAILLRDVGTRIFRLSCQGGDIEFYHPILGRGVLVKIIASPTTFPFYIVAYEKDIFRHESRDFGAKKRIGKIRLKVGLYKKILPLVSDGPLSYRYREIVTIKNSKKVNSSRSQLEIKKSYRPDFLFDLGNNAFELNHSDEKIEIHNMILGKGVLIEVQAGTGEALKFIVRYKRRDCAHSRKSLLRYDHFCRISITEGGFNKFWDRIPQDKRRNKESYQYERNNGHKNLEKSSATDCEHTQQPNQQGELQKRSHSTSIRNQNTPVSNSKNSTHEAHPLTRPNIRHTHCWCCKNQLSTQNNTQCQGCGWLKCQCGACGCGTDFVQASTKKMYQRSMTKQPAREPTSYAAPYRDADTRRTNCRKWGNVLLNTGYRSCPTCGWMVCKCGGCGCGHGGSNAYNYNKRKLASMKEW